MSFITGGAVELLYANLAAGTATAATSETQINDTTAMGVQARLEPDFWLPNNAQIGKAVHITARGVLSTAGTGPNLTMNVRGGSAGIGGPILLGTAAMSQVASLTAASWTLEADIIVSVMGAAGAHSTVQGYGSFLDAGAVTNYPWMMTGTVATLDTSITNYLSVTALFSAVSNSITLQQLLVYGLN